MPHSRCFFTVALALTLGCALDGCQKKNVETPRAQARTVSVVRVEPREIEGGLVASGELIPREDTAVFPQLTGYRVSKVLVDEGSWVKAGQPMAELDDTLLRAQLQQQRALAAQQRVMADRAEAEAARVKGVVAAGVLSQEQIEERRFAARSARAQANAQDAAAKDIETREALMTVRAPFAGLVIERNLRPGDLGASTTPWFRIAKDGQVELAADISEEDLGKLHPGALASVQLIDGTRVPGVVRLISPAINATTKLGRVRITLPVRADVRSGGFARASFLGVTRSARAAPETAIRYDADGASVMVVGPDDKVSRVAVTTGQRGGGYVELLTGPPLGARVVDKAAGMLVPGDLIRPASASAPASAPVRR